MRCMYDGEKRMGPPIGDRFVGDEMLWTNRELLHSREVGLLPRHPLRVGKQVGVTGQHAVAVEARPEVQPPFAVVEPAPTHRAGVDGEAVRAQPLDRVAMQMWAVGHSEDQDAARRQLLLQLFLPRK